MTSDPLDSIFKLPIYERRDEILTAVSNNQVTIITAETGAGKSTQVPQFLAEAGYNKIIVTQPRILAARNLCDRVRQEYSWRQGKDCTDLVGYRTAHERDDSPDNTILYCTDGLQLVRELTGSGTKDRQILVLDEVHEWNENMEVLVAWAKKRCAEDPNFKIVLMSATIEAESLAAYFNTPALITVEGRSYKVEKRSGSDLLTEIETLLTKQISNMLVFLPGKAEIENIAEALEPVANSVPIIPLHGQLEPEMQQRAFVSYPKGKVVLSTNVAQTSVTIDDIDVVIDSGLERRSEVRHGVEGLFIAEVSQADCLQRAGRAGRTKEGLYVLAQLDNLPCTPLAERPEYGVPEIVRKHIDRLVLRLAAINIDIEDLEFFHSPSKKTIKFAKQTLRSLGALTNTGQVTQIGQKMERFPVESSYARMLVQSEKYSSSVQAKLATIIAIQEVGGIVKGSTRFSEWKKYTHQNYSDLLAQYEVYLALPAINEAEYEELGIIAKNVTKAAEVNERLNRDLALGDVNLAPIEDSEVDPLLKCIVAGQLHEIWLVEPGGIAVHYASKDTRELSGSTVVKHAGLVAGRPFDLEVPTPRGLETLHLVNDLTAIDPNWLQELAPEMFKIKTGKVYFDSYYGALVSRSVVEFAGRRFETAGVPLLDRSKENQKLFVAMYSSWLHDQLERERHILQMANFRKIPQIPLNQIKRQVEYHAGGAISLLELSKKQKIELSKLAKLETYFGHEFMARFSRRTDENSHPHKRRRFSWKPGHKRRDRGHREQY